jgi:hypothetical protein
MGVKEDGGVGNFDSHRKRRFRFDIQCIHMHLSFATVQYSITNKREHILKLTVPLPIHVQLKCNWWTGKLFGPRRQCLDKTTNIYKATKIYRKSEWRAH